MVNRLLEGGAHVNRASKQGCTPLHRACREGHCAVVRALLAAGARVDVADKKGGRTPACLALQAGHKEVVRTLVSDTPHPLALAPVDLWPAPPPRRTWWVGV